jgi:hypothetical protein
VRTFVHRTTFARSERGSVLLEFALMLTILLVLMFGIIDLGRALFTANNLVSASREGARFAATMIDPDPAATGSDVVIKARVIAAFSRFGGPALTNAMIVVTPVFASGGALQSIRVTINYPFTWITPIRSLVGSMTNVLHGEAQYRWEGAAT